MLPKYTFKISVCDDVAIDRCCKVWKAIQIFDNRSSLYNVELLQLF